MKKFLIKLLIALAWVSCLIVTVYFILHEKSRRTDILDEKDVVFVWGDSQMYQGINTSLFGNKTGKTIVTSAGHGKGVYDFLVSEKNIPSNSVCVVSFPECAFFRNPLSDNNRTGLEMSCLLDLIGLGCPLNECTRIIGLNRQSINYKAFHDVEHAMYPYSDSLVYPQPLPLWHPLFEEKKDWFSWKAKSYDKGLQHLYDKNCQMILIQFPFDEQIEAFASESVNRHLSDSLKNTIVEKYSMRHDTIRLHSDSLLMHDLSHLNEVGARLLTKQVADIMRSDTTNNHFVKVIID